ncbi:MAG: endolytic transglycosylase MltG [Chloroflexi bacterium]|nr:endolytic transglycosylase MltG [Chloroflexota bacterium]
MQMMSSTVGNILKVLFGLVMVSIVVIVGVGIYFFFELGARPSVKEDIVPFRINAGESFSTIADNLQKKDLIRNTFIFRVRARMLNAEQKVQAGDFSLRRNMTVDEVLEGLSKARLNNRDVTIIEGLRLEQIANTYAQKGWDKNKFIAAVTQEDWQFGFLNDKPPGASVEGFLFPDTYKIPASFDEKQIVEMMLTRFGDQYNATLRQKARDGPGIYKVVTVASIVEREAAKEDERPVIASVFYNRLVKNMPLQTDPTVQWARDTRDAQKDSSFSKWWQVPSKEDLLIDSPYNTYKVNGLPPGPICNPGLAALQAATEPFSTDYLYFVATGDRDRSHAFAKTFEEHQANIKKYQGG